MIAIPEKIKALLMQDGTRKNFRVHFPNGEHTDITNENIISESVSFTESICSQKELKFGLCESPVIEFETFGIGKIKGAEIECSIEVFGEIFLETIQINKSGYTYQTEGKFEPGSTVKIVLDRPIPEASMMVYGASVREEMKTTDHQTFSILWTEKMNEKASSGMPTAILIAMANPSTATIKVDAVYPIPLGRFVVDSCKKQADMTHRKIVAYGMNNFSGKESMSDKFQNANYMSKNEDYTYDAIRRAFTYIDAFDSQFTKTEENLIEYNEYYSLYAGETDKTYIYIAIRGMRSNNLYLSHDLYNVECELWQDDETMFKELKKGVIRAFASVGAPIPDRIDEYIEYNINKKLHLDRKNSITRIRQPKFSFIPYVNSANTDTNVFIGLELSVISLNDNNVKTYASVAPIRNPKLYKISYPLFDKFYATEKRVKNIFNEYMWFNNWNGETARKYIEAVIELQGKFGVTKRDGALHIINIKDNFSALYPSETLYPADNLFPGGNVGAELTRSNYINLWYDDDYTLPIGAVQCEYNNGTEQTYKIVYAAGYSEESDTNTFMTYDLSNNELVKSFAILDADMTTILRTFIANASGISYMPSEISMKGRPDLEAGDVLEIATTDETITTVILQRTISGIQNLVDDIRST